MMQPTGLFRIKPLLFVYNRDLAQWVCVTPYGVYSICKSSVDSENFDFYVKSFDLFTKSEKIDYIGHNYETKDECVKLLNQHHKRILSQMLEEMFYFKPNIFDNSKKRCLNRDNILLQFPSSAFFGSWQLEIDEGKDENK